MPTLKIFLAGLPNAGKTEFIKSVSDLPLVSVEKKIVSTEELVDMDYGRAHIDRNMVYLYAPVNDNRFEFLWESLYEEMHGFILLVDITRPGDIEKSAKFYKVMVESSKYPHLTVFTKIDLLQNPPLSVNTQQFGSPEIVTSCICTRKSSTRSVLRNLLAVFKRYSISMVDP